MITLGNVLELHQLAFDFKLCEPLQYLLLVIFCNPWHCGVLICGYSFLVMLQYKQLITVCLRALKMLSLWDSGVQLSWCVQHISRTEGLSFTSVTDYK